MHYFVCGCASTVKHTCTHILNTHTPTPPTTHTQYLEIIVGHGIEVDPLVVILQLHSPEWALRRVHAHPPIDDAANDETDEENCTHADPGNDALRQHLEYTHGPIWMRWEERQFVGLQWTTTAKEAKTYNFPHACCTPNTGSHLGQIDLPLPMTSESILN